MSRQIEKGELALYKYNKIRYSFVELDAGEQQIIYIYKNGSVYSYSYQANQNNHSNYQTNYQSVIMDMNGTSDYVESFAYISRGGSTSAVLAHTRGSYFMGYRLTGA